MTWHPAGKTLIDDEFRCANVFHTRRCTGRGLHLPLPKEPLSSAAVHSAVASAGQNRLCLVLDLVLM